MKKNRKLQNQAERIAEYMRLIETNDGLSEVVKQQYIEIQPDTPFDKSYWLEYQKGIQRKSKSIPFDYVIFLDEIREARKDKKNKSKPAMMHIEVLPYDIPQAYSLEEDLVRLTMAKRRLNVIRKKLRKTDVEAIALDWTRIGGDIHDAIRKYAREYARQSN